MRILYILHTTEMYGSTLSFLSMISELKQYNIEPVIVCPCNINPTFQEELAIYKVKIIPVPLVEMILNQNSSRIEFYKNNWKKFIQSIRIICSIVKKYHPNIIHTNTGVIHEGFWVSKIMRIPHIWHLREYQDKDFYWHILPTKQLFCFMLRHSYCITITDNIKKHFTLKAKHAKRIYNGILNRGESHFYEDKNYYFIYASELSENKGVYDAIEAFKVFNITHNNYHLYLFGLGTKHDIEEINKFINKYNLQNHIILKGYKKRGEVLEYISHAKALLVPSVCEGLGRMTAEAIMLGCPVIGRATGGTKEIIEQTDGLLFHNTAEFTQQMNSIAEMSEHNYKKIITNASTKASDMFSIETSGKLIYDYYQEILNK